MSSSLCLVTLPKEAQLGKAGSSYWERPWGEKSHLLSPPQGHEAGLPKLEHALRQQFGDALPTAELEPPNQLLHSFVYAAEGGVWWRTSLPSMLQERFMAWWFKDVISAELSISWFPKRNLLYTGGFCAGVAGQG